MQDETGKTGETALFQDIGDDSAFIQRYGERIGVGMAAVIYVRDGIAAKVFRENKPKTDAFQEAYAMAVVNELNVPSPRVYGVETFCNRTVLLMDAVKGTSLLDMMLKDTGRVPYVLDKVARLQAALHAIEFSGFRTMKIMLQAMITASPGLAPAEKERLTKLLAQLPEDIRLCHGDFHGGNILCDGDSCIIIDWGEVSCGSPAADACRSYMDYYIARQGYEEQYLDAYCAVTGRTREEILAWLPVVVGSVYGYLTPEAQKIVRPLFRTM